jgi:P27 family predicted phage terminase small subunit
MAVGNKGGRPRKPTALHLLNGNPSKIPDLEQRAAAEPKPQEFTPSTVPEPPEYMPDSAKECWRENAPMLAATHLLTVADLKALEAYCIMYANFRKMASDLTKANMLVYKPHAATQPGSVYLDELPQSRMLRAYGKEMRDWAREFGMTPAARGRMVLPDAPGEVDEMEKLLRGG